MNRTAKALLAPALLLVSFHLLLSCKKGSPGESGEELSVKSNLGLEQLYVDSEGGLPLQSRPEMESERVAILPNGSSVHPLEENSEVLVSDGRPGRWTRVKSESGEGWVFGGYLSRTRPDGIEEGKLRADDVSNHDFSLAKDHFRIHFAGNGRFQGECSSPSGKKQSFQGTWEFLELHRVLIQADPPPSLETSSEGMPGENSELEGEEAYSNTVLFKKKKGSWIIYSLTDTADPCGSIIESGIWIGEDGTEILYWKDL